MSFLLFQDWGGWNLLQAVLFHVLTLCYLSHKVFLTGMKIKELNEKLNLQNRRLAFKVFNEVN